MSEEKTEQTAAPETKGQENQTFKQEDVDRIVTERLAREREKYAGYDELKDKASKYDELEASKQSTEERLTKKLTGTEKELETTRHENLRLRVGAAKKLPEEFIDRLRGTTKEEMEEDADRLLALLKPGTPNGSADQGARGGSEAASGDMNALIRRGAQRGT